MFHISNMVVVLLCLLGTLHATDPLLPPSTTPLAPQSDSVALKSTPSTLPQLKQPAVEDTSALEPAETSEPEETETTAWSPTTGGPSLDLKAMTQPAEPEVYKARLQILQDSLNALDAAKQSVLQSASSDMTPLAAKGEFEKSADYEKRKKAWEDQATQKAAARLKPLDERIQSLETTKKTVLELAEAMVATLKITSEPSGVTVKINGKVSGTTPLTIKDQWPGEYSVSLEKEGFLNWSSQLNVKAKSEIQLKALMQKAFVHLPVGEINFSQAMKEGQSLEAYHQSINQVKARRTKVQEDLKSKLSSIESQLPALAPKGEFERTEDFNKRKQAWETTRSQKTGAMEKDYKEYLARLDRLEKALLDQMVLKEKQGERLVLPAGSINPGTYNADTEKYPLTLQYETDSLRFRFQGSTKLSIPQAKLFKEDAADIQPTVVYYPIPVQINGTKVYPALKQLEINHKKLNLNPSGDFLLPPDWVNDPGVLAAIARADSLEKDLIQSQGLDLAWVYGAESSKGSGGMSPTAKKVLLWTTRVALAAGGTALFGYAWTQDQKAADIADSYNPANLNEAIRLQNDIREYETNRDRGLGIGAGLWTLAAISFAF